jgi:hypothetical protein
MRTEREPASFDMYFADFMSEHTTAGTRWCHFVGLHVGVIAGTTGLLRRRPALVVAAAAFTATLDVGSHYVFEGGYPGKSLARPMWSVRANLVMVRAMWRGRQAELDRLAAAAEGREVVGVRERARVHSGAGAI